jgi:hypothetical protein
VALRSTDKEKAKSPLLVRQARLTWLVARFDSLFRRKKVLQRLLNTDRCGIRIRVAGLYEAFALKANSVSDYHHEARLT